MNTSLGRSARALTLFTGSALLALAPAALGQTWNATTQFSVDNGNPNGVWSYGWMEVGFGPLTLYTNSGYPNGCPQWWGWGGDRTPTVWRNFTSDGAWGVPLGAISLHPGNGTQPTVVRFTVPAGAPTTLQVRGRFMRGDIGVMMVAVRVNNTEVWSHPDDGVFDLKLILSAGDTIDFTAYDGYGFGNTPLEAVISAACNLADVTEIGGSVELPGWPDGQLTVDDIITFVGSFSDGLGCPGTSPCSRADVCGIGGPPEGPDGQLTVDDIIAFVNAFGDGCP